MGDDARMGATKPISSQVNLVTRDFGATLEFDNQKLASVYNAAWRQPGRSSHALIGFRVATREEVDTRYAVVADPDGTDVGSMSPQDDAKRSWPPANSPDR